MPEMDQGIKRLLQTHPADVIGLALPGAEYLAPLTTDVATEPQLVLDTLFHIRYQGEDCGVNVEIQAQPDPQMPRRCFEYGARASIVYQLPVLSVVLWLEQRGKLPLSPYEMRVGQWLQATWHFTSIAVYELDAAQAVAHGPVGLLPLVPFMRGAELPVLERAVRLAREQATGPEAGDLVALLAVYVARFRGDAVARELVRRVLMSTELLDESPLYQAWRREWQEEGRKAGLAEGREEGRETALREAVRAALTGRFGTLDEPVLAAITAASEAALLDLLAHVASESLEQLRVRLGSA